MLSSPAAKTARRDGFVRRAAAGCKARTIRHPRAEPGIDGATARRYSSNAHFGTLRASAAASRAVDLFTPKPVLVTGLLIATAGFIFLTQLSGHGDYTSHVLPAMVILGLGLGMSFVPATIAATTGVAPEDSGLASGLLNTTQQVGGSLGLAILTTVSTTRIADALHGGAGLPVALTHGFKGAFTVAGLLCAAGAVLALVLLPRHKRAVENEQVETIATSSARCPGAPYFGRLARVASLARRT